MQAEDRAASASKPTESVEAVLKESRLRFLRKSSPVVLPSDTSVGEVIRRLQGSQDGAALITESDGRLAGIFTERDYLDKIAVADKRARSRQSFDTPIERLMTRSPRTLTPDHTVGDAIQLMTQGGYRHIPVVEPDGRIYGLVSASDAVAFIAEHFPAEVFNLPPRFHQPIRTREGG